MRGWLVVAGAVLFGIVAPVAAQPYPNRPVTIVVPFPPGGATDILARQLARKLPEAMGQQFVVENRPGAGGTVGSRAVLKSPANGYTLLMGTNASHAIAAALNPNLGYDPVKDFLPVSLVAIVPQVLMVNTSVPVSNVKELIAYAQQRPGALNFGSAGNGTPGHLGPELFKMMAGIDMVHVPFQGGAPALTALVGGQVQVLADNVNSALPQIRAGKVKAIAVTSAKRSGALPELATIAEQALPGFDSGSWFALFAPGGTPAEIVARLNAETIKALAAPDVRDVLAQQGAELAAGPPEELTRLIRSDIEKWGQVIRKIGLKPE